MTGVALFELTLLLMAVIIGLELLARRRRMPPAAAFIGGGGALAFVPGAPDIGLDPDLALVLFLPPLLASSAYKLDLEELSAIRWALRRSQSRRFGTASTFSSLDDRMSPGFRA